jgi:hypothetical protein
MTIFAIDPGPKRSALVIYHHSGAIREHRKSENWQLLRALREQPKCDSDVMVLEQVAAMGLAVGAETFETCVWSGRFIEAWIHGSPSAWDRIKRHEVKQALCRTQRAKDPHIRQALIDRFGGKAAAIGNKKSPGPLHGISGDEWSALAVAIAWWERNSKDGATWNKQ